MICCENVMDKTLIFLVESSINWHMSLLLGGPGIEIKTCEWSQGSTGGIIKCLHNLKE